MAMRKRMLFGAGILVAATIVCLFTVQMRVVPPGETRLILEYTYETFISPPCFEQAEVTNNLFEATLAKARKLNFKADSVCTEQSLEGVDKRLFDVMLEKLGLQKNSWDWYKN